jgi:hypothetical protein
VKLSKDVDVYGRCDCHTADVMPAVSYAACGGCGHGVRYLRDESVHWRGQHWHVVCALDSAVAALAAEEGSASNG